MNQRVFVVIPMKAMPKKRPRFNGNHAYHEPAYRQWLELFRTVVSVFRLDPIEGYFRAHFEFHQPTKPLGDTDNLVGAVMDGLQGHAFANDRMCVGGTWEWVPDWEEEIRVVIEEAPDVVPLKKPKQRKRKVS